MNATISQEQLYDLDVAVLDDVDKVASTVDDLCAMTRALNMEVSTMRREMAELAVLRRRNELLP